MCNEENQLQVEAMTPTAGGQERCKVWEMRGSIRDGYEVFVKEGAEWKWVPKQEYIWYPLPGANDPLEILTSMKDAIGKMYQSADPMIRLRAGEILIKNDRENVIKMVSELLVNKDTEVRFRAARLLVENRDKNGIPVLIELVNDKEYGRETINLLQDATGQPFGKRQGVVSKDNDELYANRWRTWWAANKDTFQFGAKPEPPKPIFQVTGKDIPPEVSEQIGRLESLNAAERIDAAEKLGAMGEKAAPAIPRLLMLLNDKTMTGARKMDLNSNFTPSIAAGKALVRIGKPAVEPLLEASKAPVTLAMRLKILTLLLVDMREPRAVEPLLLYTRMYDDRMRSHAVYALKTYSGQDFGDKLEDAEKWKEWWEKNKASLLGGGKTL